MRSQKSFQRLNITTHTHTDELTLRADNEYIGIRLLEPEENWWYGTTVDSSRAGIFPANYVEIIQEKVSETKTTKTEGTMNPIAVSQEADNNDTPKDISEKPGCCCTVS